MKSMPRILAAAAAAALLSFGAHTVAEAAPAIGKAAPAFTLTDTNGQSHNLADFKGKYVVLEWFNYDCPFVKKHYKPGNMQALQKRYTEKGVVWLGICSSAPGKQGHYDGAAMNSRTAKEKAAQTAVLLDGDGKVGRLYQAKTTPHMFVINPEGQLIYMGAIDSVRSANPADIEGAQNYVAAALDAAMAGKKPILAVTKPYGCSVKY